MRGRVLKRIVPMFWIVSAISAFLLVAYYRIVLVPARENPLEVGWLKDVHWTPGTLKVGIYDFLINPSDTCKLGSRDMTLLLLVKSAPSNKPRRDVIRETYVSGIRELNLPARVLFVLGNVEDSMERESIRTEADLHGDILQADFKDHYYNLTIKLITGFKWVANFCRNTEFVMSIDDDVMLDIVTLVQDLEGLPSWNRTNLCLGEPNVGKPIRNEDSKWYCPKELYPEDTYPLSPFGAGYVLSQDSVQKLYAASKEVLPKVPFDDVYCGMLLDATGIAIADRVKLYAKLHPERKPKDYLKSQLSVYQMKKARDNWEDFKSVPEREIHITKRAKLFIFPFLLVLLLCMFFICTIVHC
ncbi:lactosylceramide 1,3-N-acetyl-beta-D-glucosaminyltransferase A-like [Lytechinus pictus]|uniref:lactosylceramide 1,3-N-acetyl-beta-D-glucosaminyltransferase A-like n=1 Tax=Lytechinus pictus TaxID=7653 RepID=UPI0030BA0C4E